MFIFVAFPMGFISKLFRRRREKELQKTMFIKREDFTTSMDLFTSLIKFSAIATGAMDTSVRKDCEFLFFKWRNDFFCQK
jgi:hypothetical protein